jgi:glyoxylase-like metal-dependent hydrolase (beta-lactamase superfamily II)
VPVARRLEDGETIELDGPVPERWTVLHTPGHAPGHVCLWNDAERVVVVGDMVASVGTILIHPRDGDMGTYLDQLERLASLDAQFALPAHGDPIEQPTALFRWYVAHRLKREAKILGVVARAGAPGITAEEVLPGAYDDVPPGTWPIALLSVQAHLEKLLRDGQVRATPEGRYVAAA